MDPHLSNQNDIADRPQAKPSQLPESPPAASNIEKQAISPPLSINDQAIEETGNRLNLHDQPQQASNSSPKETANSREFPTAPKNTHRHNSKPTAPSWNVVGASIRGAVHIQHGLPCQDYHHFEFLKNNGIVAAVADGLGSASRADEGAKLAVETFINYIGDAVNQSVPTDKKAWEDLITNGFRQAKNALETLAESNNTPLREYGTTLVSIVIMDSWLVTGQIGDGGIVARADDGKLHTVSTPKNGEYANLVAPLTASNALELAEFIAESGYNIQAAALFTDGIQHLVLDNRDNSPHPLFFDPFFDELAVIDDCQQGTQQLQFYLASDRINAKTDDDKTLLLIARRQDPEHARLTEN